jgi:hypothetical protein
MMADGWFKVHRGWMDNPVFKDDSERLCWLWLIEKAAWHDTYHDVHGARCDVPRGSVFLTHRQIGKRFTWSNSKVAKFLSRLKNEDMIEYKTETKKGQISICNYDKYQQSKDKTSTKTGQQSEHKRKKPLKKEEREGPSGISNTEIIMAHFREMYLSVKKPNWTSKEETVKKYLNLAVKRDGEQAVLTGTQRYTEDCIKEGRPAYNPQKFLSQGLYRDWAEKPASPKYEVGFL